MDYLTLLLFLSFVLLILCIKVSGNLLSPGSIFMFVFVFSISCAYYSKDTWDFVMSAKTFFTILAGMLTFLVVAFFVNSKRPKNNINYEPKEIKLSNLKILILYLFYIVCSSIYLYFMCKEVNTFNLLQAGSIFRNLSRELIVEVPLIARLCLLGLRCVSTVLCCVVINNYFVNRLKRKREYHLIFLIIMYVVLTILTGERTSMLRIIGVLVLAFCIFYQRKYHFRKLGSLKIITTCSICVFLLLILFSYIRYFVGRTSELNFLDYISFYAGGPIYNLNYAINNFVKPTYDGYYTFLGVSNNLARLGFGIVRSVHREIVIIASKKIFLGNVYTCFYDYYMDFGLFGMIVLIGLYSYIINKMYIMAKFSIKNTFIKTVIFIYFGTTLFFVSFTEQFYSSYIAISTVESLVLIIITVWFLSAKFSVNKNFICKFF